MSDPFIGEIKMFAGNYAPSGYALCLGQQLTAQQNQALFALIGNTYGGNGSTTFNLPNMQGRVPVGTGNFADSSGTYMVNPGKTGGALNTQLTVANLPPHTHAATFTPTGQSAVNVSVSVGTSSSAPITNPTPDSTVYLTAAQAQTDSGDPVALSGLYTNAVTGTLAKLGGVQVTGNAAAGSVTVGSTGSGALFTNLQPYLGVSFIIALQGIWPTRD